MRSTMSHDDQSPTSSADERPSGSDYSRDASQQRYAASYQRRQRGRGIRKALAIGIPALIVLVLVVGVASAAGFVGSLGSRMNAGVTAATRSTLADQQAKAKARAASNLTENGADLPANWQDTAPFYMLLLGVDKSENRTEGDEAQFYGTSDANFRSDTIILARIDPGQKKVTLVSIHRDTFIDIDGKQQKINAAYAIGGVSKVIEVVSQFAGVPIEHYAEVDIDGLAAITDAMGGVTVDVPFDINDDEYTGSLSAGVQTLNGQEALIFTRSRHAYDNMGDGDRYRAANQRAFLSAMASQLLSSSPVTIVAAINTLANYITTDLTVDQIASLALTMQGMDTSTDIYSTMNPTQNEYVNGASVEINQTERWQQIMQAVDAGQEPPADGDIMTASHSASAAADAAAASTNPTATANHSASVVVRGLDTSPMSSSDVAAKLQAAGFTNVTMGDQASGLTAGSMVDVVYLDAAQKSTAEAVAAALGSGARAVDGAAEGWSIVGDVMVVVGVSS